MHEIHTGKEFKNVAFWWRMHDETYNNCVFDHCSFQSTTIYLGKFFDCKFIGCLFDNVNIDLTQFENCSFDSCQRRNVYGYNNIFHNVSIPMVCPEEGEFTAYKVVSSVKGYRIIAELLIPAGAMRSSGIGTKCRAACAKVVRFLDTKGNPLKNRKAFSNYDPLYAYYRGQVAYPDAFDEDRWQECSSGIHFFMTFQEAKEWW